MIAGPVVVMLAAPFAGHISDRMDAYLSSAGMAVAAAGLFF